MYDTHIDKHTRPQMKVRENARKVKCNMIHGSFAPHLLAA